MKTYALEVFLATMMVTCGMALAWPGDTFMLPHYAIMRLWVDELTGGFILVVAGLIRLYAIQRNGSDRYSPLWRIAGCCIGSGFWLCLAIAVVIEVNFDGERPSGLGLPLLLPLTVSAFVFEILAAIRGGGDANLNDSLNIRQREFQRRNGDGAGNA